MGFPAPASQLKLLLVTLRQPGSIAAIISLVIHGALFGAGLGFSSLSMASLGGESAGAAEQRRVPLVELTPEEQGRLPDFSNSAYSLFPGSGGNSLGLVPVPSSRTPSSLRPSPLSPDSKNDFTIPPNPFAIGMAPYFPPSRPDVIFPPRRSTGLPPVTVAPRRNLPQLPAGAPQTRPNTTPGGAASTPSASTPTAQDNPDTPPASSARDLLPAPPPTTARGRTQPGSSTPTSTANAGSENAGDNPENNSENNAENEASRSNLLAYLRTLSYNAEGTTGEEGTAARQEWLAEVKEELKQPDLDVAETLEVSIPYQGRVCLTPEPVDGLVGVWVNPDGTLGGEPTLLKSTGYQLLNQEAADAIASVEFPKGDAPAAYDFNVKIDYDESSCLKREQILQQNNAG